MGLFSGKGSSGGDNGKDSGGKGGRGKHAGPMSIKSGKMRPSELGKHRHKGDLYGIADEDFFGWVGED